MYYLTLIRGYKQLHFLASPTTVLQPAIKAKSLFRLGETFS